MAEEGERVEGHRRTGPNPGPYPWPGPGPGYHISDNADPSRKPHVQQHSAKKNKLSVLYGHRPVYEESSKSQDCSRESRRISSTASSTPLQARVQSNEDRHLSCRPYEVQSKTSSTNSGTGTHFRNKAFSSKFNSLSILKDKDIPKEYLHAGCGPSLASVGKISGLVAHRNYQENVSRHKRKPHFLKVPDPLRYPLSVHPVQPPDLRCKYTVNRESFRKILSGEANLVPVPETRRHFLGVNKKSQTSLQLVCAETSNPDIKISNIDEACTTTFSNAEQTESQVSEVSENDYTLNQHKKSLSKSSSHSLATGGDLSHEKTAEYSLMGRDDTRLNRVDCVLFPEVHFTSPDGKELKMERYFPPKKDSVECSIHSCGMSSSILSGVTLEHDMTPSEKLAHVLPSRETPQNVLSIASLADKEAIKVPDPKDVIDSSRTGQFFHRICFPSLSRDPSFCDLDGEISSPNRVPWNDNDQSNLSNSNSSRDMSEKITNVKIRQNSETTLHKNLRYLLRDERSLDTCRILSDTAPINQDTEGRIPCEEEKQSVSYVQIPERAEKVPDTMPIIVDSSEIISNPAEEGPQEAENIVVTANVIQHTADRNHFGSFNFYESYTDEKFPGMDGRTPGAIKVSLDTGEMFPILKKSLPDIALNTIDRHSVSYKVSDAYPACDRILDVAERIPQEENRSALPLECKSSSVQTSDDIKINITQTSRVNMIFLVSSSVQRNCAEEIHLKMGSEDLVIDIRDDQSTGVLCESTHVLEKKETDDLNKSGPFVSVGVLRDDGTTRIRNKTPDRLMVTAKTTKDSKTTLNTTNVLHLQQQKNDVNAQVEGSLPVSDFSDSETTAITQPGKLSIKSPKRSCVEEGGSGVRDLSSAKHLLIGRRYQRRNTIPKMSSEGIDFQRKNLFHERTYEVSNNASVSKSLEMPGAERNAILNSAKSLFARDATDVKVSSNGNCQLNTEIQNLRSCTDSVNAECQVSLVASTEISESAEDYESKTSKDYLGVSCRYEMERTPDEGSEGESDKFQEGASQQIFQKNFSDEPDKVANLIHNDINSYFKAAYDLSKDDLNHAREDTSFSAFTDKNIELSEKTFRGMDQILSEVKMGNPTVPGYHFTPGMNNLGELFKASPDDISSDIKRSIQQTPEQRRHKNDVCLEKFRNESCDQINVQTPTDKENRSSEPAVKTIAQDISVLTAVFRRNSNDMHSSQENLDSVNENRADSQKTSISTKLSGQVSSLNQSTGEHENYSASQGNRRDEECCFEVNNNSISLSHETIGSVEKRPQFVQDTNRYEQHSTEGQQCHEKNQKISKLTALIRIESTSRISGSRECVTDGNTGENGNFGESSSQNKINQAVCESTEFSLGSQDLYKRTFIDVIDFGVEMGHVETEKNTKTNPKTGFDRVERRFDIVKNMAAVKRPDAVEHNVDVNNFQNEREMFNNKRLCLDNSEKGSEKTPRGFTSKQVNSDTWEASFDCKRKSPENEAKSFNRAEGEFNGLGKTFSEVKNSLNSPKARVKETSDLQNISTWCNHEDCNEADDRLCRKNLFDRKHNVESHPEFRSSMKWSSSDNCWTYSFQKISKCELTYNESEQSIRTCSASPRNTSINSKVILNGCSPVGHQSDILGKRACSMCENESGAKEFSTGKNVESRTTKSASEPVSRSVDRDLQAIEKGRVLSCGAADPNEDSHELTGSQATSFGCVEDEAYPVQGIPLDSEIDTVLLCFEKAGALEDQTRSKVTCSKSPSNSEEPACIAEQLPLASFEIEVYEENMTAKSVADLSDDNMPHGTNKDIDGESGSLDNNTEQIDELIMATVLPMAGFKEKRKSEMSSYAVRRSSSGVYIATFDNCQVSALVKITDMVTDFGNHMSMVEKGFVSPKNVTDCVLTPQIFFPDDEACKSALSLETIRGGPRKSILKSGRSSRGSGRVEWTISVNDENGKETRRSVDIITLNDTTDQIETKRQSNTEEARVTVESPGMSLSTSSHNTRVLKNPSNSSSPSICIVRDLSLIYAGFSGNPHFTGVQKKEDNETRTKLMKKRLDKKTDSHKRWHLFENISGNVLEVYDRERKRKLINGHVINTVRPGDNVPKRGRNGTRGHASNYMENGDENTRCITGGCNHEREIYKGGPSMPSVREVSSSTQEHEFEQYRSISDMCVTQSERMASDSDDSDNDDLGSSKKSVSPSLLNLECFTPCSNPSSWSTLRHRQTMSSRAATNLLTVHPTQSRTSNKFISRSLHSDEESDSARSHPDSKRRFRRSDGFLLSSSNLLRPVSGRSGRNMLSDTSDVRARRRDGDVIRESESGATCLASYDPEVSHGVRVVTFENIPSPPNTLCRPTLTPRGESVQTFDHPESYEDVTLQPPRSPSSLCSYSTDRFLHASRLSSDASGCCIDELSSAAIHGRVDTSIARNRYYEQVPFKSMSYESIEMRGRSATTGNANVEQRSQTIGPKAAVLSSKTQTTRSHSDLRVLTASKTTLLSLVEAGAHSTSRLSSPTPSDIPSPPPNASPNRLATCLSLTKVDVAVGVNTLDCNANSCPRLSESAVPMSDYCHDSMTVIKVPVSPVRNKYSSGASDNAVSIPMATCTSFATGNSNTRQSLDDCAEELGSVVPIFVPSNIYPKNTAISRGVVTTSSAVLCGPSTTSTRSCETDYLQESDGANEQQEIDRTGARKRCAVNHLRIPIVAKVADSESTRDSILDTTDERDEGKYITDVITDSSLNGHLAETGRNLTMHRPVIMGGHYRFGLVGQRGCKCSNLMGDINSAVPSRSTLSRSSGPTNRISPNVIGSHARFIGARRLEPSCSVVAVDSSSELLEPQKCHRERDSYAQKPRQKLIKRPADASCRSSTLSKTSNTIQANSGEAQVDSGWDANSKRALPPAALNQSEEAIDSNQRAACVLNAGVLAGFPADIPTAPGKGPSPTSGSSTVRFSNMLLKSRTDSGHPDTCEPANYQSTSGTGRTASAGPPNPTASSTVGKSFPGCLRETACQDPSSTHQDERTSSAQLQMDHRLPSSGATTHFGVVTPQINVPVLNSHPICISINSSNGDPSSSMMASSHESRTTQPSSLHLKLDFTKPAESQGYNRTDKCVPVNGIPEFPARVSDASSGTQRSRGTLASQSQIRESISSQQSINSREQNSLSLSTNHQNKQKSSSSVKSVHKTGSRTTRGTVRKHVKRNSSTSSQTAQPSPISPSAVAFNTSSQLIEMDERRSQVRSLIPWFTPVDDGEEDEGESYIEEVSETIEEVPTVRIVCKCTAGPLSTKPNVESMMTETLDFTSEALSRTENPLAHSDICIPREGTRGRVEETSETSGQSALFGKIRETGSEGRSTDEDLMSSRMTQVGSDKPADAETEGGRITQPQTEACIDDAICKDVEHPLRSGRYGLYSTRVGYIGPPRPPHHLATTARRAVAEKDIQFPFILARPEAKPRRNCRTIYDEARGKAPSKEEESEKDYIQTNKNNVCQAVPLKKPPRYVDSVHGHSQLLEPSGLEPRYVFRKDYGVVPSYLNQMGFGNKARKAVSGSGSEFGAEGDAATQASPLRYITEPERAQLIEGLKQNWQELTTVFQGLPVMTDTMAKMKRKEALENELRQLERDITTIEENPIIYIDRASGDACNADHIWVE